MAMFDLGKRGSNPGQEHDHEEELRKEMDKPVSAAAPSPVGSPASGSTRRRDAAIIGPSIHIEGTLRGEEDLIIEGRVNGTVQLHDNSLTIGSHGQLKADIYAHTIFVEGTVEGDLYGSERIAIKKTADIRGNVMSPRVSLEDGAKFKGSIEMDAQAVENAMGSRKQRAAGGSAQANPQANPQAIAGASAQPVGQSQQANVKPAASQASAASGVSASTKPAFKDGASGTGA